MNMEPEIGVTRIKLRWHIRLCLDGVVLDEMACINQLDIGWCCREMLRWYDKTGGGSSFASAARDRQTVGPSDKVWYKVDLQGER